MLFLEAAQDPSVELSRLTGVKYSDCSMRFKLQAKSDYSKQYAHIYAKRLDEMRSLLLEKVTEKWGTKYVVKKMSDLREDNPEKCIIIGTTFVHQRLKPSILREISEETQLAPQPIRQNYVDETDVLILEDEVQRIRLLGNMNPHSFVTGIVCAVLGTDCYENDEGKFYVDDFLFYESGPQKPLSTLPTSPLVVLISGLDQSSAQDFSMSLELFQQWIYGNLPNVFSEPDFEASNIIRVIVAGNSVRTTSEHRPKTLLMRQPESFSTLQAVKSVDDIFHCWSKSVNVDLMPGEFDPSNCMIPQQPLHSCMFPESSANKYFKCVTNPYELEIEDRLILGTAGQNLSNIQKYSNIDDSIEVLKSIVKWSILAPTAPDTLPCYPYTDSDPFIIKRCPHILFAGNTTEYGTTLYEDSKGQRIRLICVPSFSKKESVVVVNLQNLECKQLCFKLKGFDELEF